MSRPPDESHPLRAWWRRQVADQALARTRSIIRVRQHELEVLIEEARARAGQPQLTTRLARAELLVREQPRPDDRASAEELLAQLDTIVPMVVSDHQLCLMAERECAAAGMTLSEVERRRASQVLEANPTFDLSPVDRQQLECLLDAAVRERANRARDDRILAELRKNYLTWLSLMLLLLLPGAALAGVAADRYGTPRHGLWAHIVLAVLAGALGGTLSGVIRLQKPEVQLGKLRNLGLALFAQPLLGAVGGLVLFAIWRSGLLAVKGLDDRDWSSTAVVAFAGGFSERLFLRSLERITGPRGEQPEMDHTPGQ